MTKKPSKRLRLLLTDRAVNDILDIERYSIEQFGKRVANRYLAKLEAALQRISAEPGLSVSTSKPATARQVWPSEWQIRDHGRRHFGRLIGSGAAGSVESNVSGTGLCDCLRQWHHVDSIRQRVAPRRGRHHQQAVEVKILTGDPH